MPRFTGLCLAAVASFAAGVKLEESRNPWEQIMKGAAGKNGGLPTDMIGSIMKGLTGSSGLDQVARLVPGGLPNNTDLGKKAMDALQEAVAHLKDGRNAEKVHDALGDVEREATALLKSIDRSVDQLGASCQNLTAEDEAAIATQLRVFAFDVYNAATKTGGMAIHAFQTEMLKELPRVTQDRVAPLLGMADSAFNGWKAMMNSTISSVGAGAPDSVCEEFHFAYRPRQYNISHVIPGIDYLKGFLPMVVPIITSRTPQVAAKVTAVLSESFSMADRVARKLEATEYNWKENVHPVFEQLRCKTSPTGKGYREPVPAKTKTNARVAQSAAALTRPGAPLLVSAILLRLLA